MRLFFCLLCLLLAPLAYAQQTQDPIGQWRAIHTPHYRIFYPLQAEPWARTVAGQIESIRAHNVAEIGYDPPQVTDVIVMDPYRMSNGFALPLLRNPRMGLFATPPQSTSVIGWYRSWAEELVVHEDAHLVHLLRPSRGSFGRLTQRITGIGVMSTKSPGWVVEGYATVVEGRLTPRGRPNGDYRALLLRRLATQGQLPTYDQLDGAARWQGGSFRYLVGSAYLEWLVARTHEGALRDLWARMTAVEERSFEEDFKGIFGDSPSALYARFAAEVTHNALDIEAARPRDADTLWLDRRWTAGTPALSPDGSRLALVSYQETGPTALLVFDTAPNEQGEKEWQEHVDQVLARDPEDVAPVKPTALPRTPVATRVHLARPPGDPRWTQGNLLLFPAWVEDGRGWRRPDLFLYDPDTNGERRLTHGADIMSADPLHHTFEAIAVRSDWGSQQLVRVDLGNGQWTALTEPDPTVVYASPRVHPDDQRVAVLRHDADRWQLVVRDLATGAETTVPTPADALVADPAWTSDGQALIVSLGIEGFVELYRLTLDGALTQLTHSPGGAAGAAPTPDGAAVFYLALDAYGLDVHRLELDKALPPSLVPEVAAVPNVRNPPPTSQDLPEVTPPGEAQPYGLGHNEMNPVSGLQIGPRLASFEIGVRLGDPVGRHEALLMAAYAPDLRGWRGMSLGWAYRGLPVTLQVHTWLFEEMQPVATNSRVGASLTLSHTARAGGTVLQSTLGALVDAPFNEDRTALRTLGFAEADFTARTLKRPIWLEFTAQARTLGGGTGGQAWMLGSGRAGVGLGVGPMGLRASYAAGLSNGESSLDRFTVGGADVSLVPRAWMFSRVLDPSLRPRDMVVPAYDEVRIDWTANGGGLFWQGRRLGTECSGLDCQREGNYSIAGVTFDTRTLPVSLAGLPGSHVWAGAACIIENAHQGRSNKPCSQLDQYAAWVGVAWQP